MFTAHKSSRVVCRSLILASLAAAAFAAQPIVKTVPWVAADPSVPHDAVAFKAVTLKGTSSLQGSSIRATWDFGDGSPAVSSTVTNSFDVSATHVYSGVVGTTYNARLTVSDLSTGEYSFADYPVAVRDTTLDAMVNVAIDEGLWYLHRSMNRTATTGDWQGTACYACDVTGEATAWNLLAFERQGHSDLGDSADPYTETVARARAAVVVQMAAQQPKGTVWARAAQVSNQANAQAALPAEAASIASVDAGTLVARQNPQGYWLGNNPASSAGFETAQALSVLSATPIHLAGVNSVTNVSSQVQVTNTGFTFNRATGIYSGNLTVKNITGSTIAGPITVGITNLPAGVTLTNSNGTFNTWPYRTITPNPILPGASVTVPITFSDPSNVAISFNRFTYSGSFPPAALTLACPANTATVNTPYNSTPDANGGVLAYTFSISVGSLPAGLNINATTGAITGTPTTAGNVSFTILVTDAAGQNGQTASQPCSINVAPDTTPQTITFTSPAPAGAVVGGPSYTPAATATSGLTVTLTIDAVSTGICSISGGAVTFQAVGTCVVDANQAGNATYSAAPQVQQSFAVGKANQTISFTSTAPAGASVGGAPYSVTATATSGLPVAFTIDASATAICSISGSAVSFLTVGTCVINANQAGNANYNVAPQVQQSFAVGKGNQTITFTSTPPATPTVGGPTYNVTATATSGLAVTFTIDGGSAGICSIAGSTVSFLASGDCVINANQAGNANYNSAPQAQQTIGVGKSAQTISFTSTAPAGAVVGGPTYNVTASATSSLTVTFTIDGAATSVCSIAGSTVSFLTAGTCVINANQAGNASFNAAPQVQQSFPVGQGSQTISFSSSAPGAAAVGGLTYNVTATATSGLTVAFTSNTPAVCSVTGSTVAFLAAGTCTINANQAGNGNYSAAPQAQQTFSVGKGNQTISFSSVAPVNATVGGATYNVTATATSGLAVAFTSNTPAICGVSGFTVSFIAAGTCVINANQAGDANYNAAPQAQQAVSVAKGDQTITFTSTAPSNALVGVANYTPTATATSGLPVTLTIDASSNTVCSISGGVVSFLAGGTCTINANQAGNANYNAAVQVQQSFQVSQPPTITSVDHVTFKPGLPGQSFTVTTTGFPAGASMVISQTGTLPGGISFTNNANGTATIAGTPASGTAGSTGTPPSQIYPLVITANNGIAPNAVQNPFNLTIACPVITVSNGPTSPWQLVFNTLSTSAAFAQTGGSATITWSATGLPTGLAIGSATGVIGGTPSVTGIFSVVVTATDAGGCIGTKALTVNVGPNLVSQAFTGVGNTQLYVTGVAGAPTTPAVVSATGLLLNATPAGQVLITGANCSVGGTITTDGAGLFIFTPDLSATSATCTYTASSNTGGGASSGAASTTANLTFTLNNRVWYVTHGASGGDGRSNTPDGDFGAGGSQLNCTATTATGEFIHVAKGSGNTTGACALKASQSLIGAGATLTVGPLTVTGNTANTPTLTGTVTLANSVIVNGIDMSTGGSSAIVGTSVTGVNVTPRDVSSTTGTTVSIGGTGNTGTYSFHSISANGATNGISLANMTGSFTVAGDGNTSVGGNSSGGVIQNTSGAGITMTNVQNISFTNMNIHDNARSGVDGQTVANFTFKNSTINNVGTGAAGQHEESNIAFNDGGAFSNPILTGVVNITNNTLTNARRHGIQIENGSGTISNLTITGNTLTSSTSSASSLGSGILVLQQGSASTTSHITTGSISGNTITNFPSAEGISVLGGSGTGANSTSATLGANGTPIAITNNRVSGQATAGQHTGSNAIRVSMNSQVGVMNFNISCNGNTTSPCTASGSNTNIEGQAISAFAGGNITGSTTIDSNVAVLNHTLAAGTAGIAVQVDDGPAGLTNTTADYNFIVTNNKVSQYDGYGIRAIARNSNGKMDATIKNNQVGTTIQLTNRNAIRVDSGTSAGDTNTCLDMTGNAGVGGSPAKLSGSGLNAGIGLRKQGSVATTNDFNLAGIGASPTNAQVQTFVGGNNLSNDGPGGSGSLSGVDILSGSNYGTCTITP